MRHVARTHFAYPPNEWRAGRDPELSTLSATSGNYCRILVCGVKHHRACRGVHFLKVPRGGRHLSELQVSVETAHSPRQPSPARLVTLRFPLASDFALQFTVTSSDVHPIHAVPNWDGQKGIGCDVGFCNFTPCLDLCSYSRSTIRIGTRWDTRTALAHSSFSAPKKNSRQRRCDSQTTCIDREVQPWAKFMRVGSRLAQSRFEKAPPCMHCCQP